MHTLSLIALALGVSWRLYWHTMEKRADRNKPKTKHHLFQVERAGIFIISVFILTQLLGLVVFPFHSPVVQTVGLVITFLGFIECMIARHNLADNWANSFEYQIKEKHELITSGIYRYVRHPIYGGMWLMGCGMLLVAGSLTVVIYIPVVMTALVPLARREEKLLTDTFGLHYSAYMKTSKRFIPFVW